MGSFASTMKCSLAVMAVFLGKAAATASSPMMAANSTSPTVTSQDMEWLKATVLPLAVFLLGSACTRACIRITGFWRSSRERGRDEPSNAPTQHPDLERAGSLELQHARIGVDDDQLAATSAQVPLAVRATPLESPNDEGKYEPTDVALKV